MHKAYLLLTIAYSNNIRLTLPVVTGVGIYSSKDIASSHGISAVLWETEGESFQAAVDEMHRIIQYVPQFRWVWPWVDPTEGAHHRKYNLDARRKEELGDTAIMPEDIPVPPDATYITKILGDVRVSDELKVLEDMFEKKGFPKNVTLAALAAAGTELHHVMRKEALAKKPPEGLTEEEKIKWCAENGGHIDSGNMFGMSCARCPYIEPW